MRMTAAGLALAAAGMAGCDLHGLRPDGSGTIECTQVQVSFSVAGRIQVLPPQEGDRLKAGAVVGQLDPTDYELKVAEARAAFAQARAQLELILAGTREEDIQRARDQVREARAAAQAAEADAGRIRMVYEKKSATQKQMDDAQAAADRTAAVLAAAGQNLSKLIRGSRAEEVRIAQAAVDLAEVRVAQAEKALSDCLVTAPLAGVVTTRVREPGEYVTAGAPVVMLSRLDEVWLSVYIPEPSIARVKVGQRAWVKVDGRDTRFEGRITFVSPEAEFTPRNVQTPDERAKLVYRVKIALPNPEGLFKPGLPADGYLE